MLSIRHIVAVASGKGGVGKSTTALHLALAMQAQGLHVGLLDADIYGPNQPQLLGTVGRKPDCREDGRLAPVVAYGLPTLSIAHLTEANAPVIWRGPMASRALQQLLLHTDWGELDVLVVDLPPGTGDIPLTLAQKLPLTGAIIVTTPQALALSDVRRAIGMLQKVCVPLLGVIENMSIHVCPHCGFEAALFGAGGAAKLATEYGMPLLGAIPLDQQLQEAADRGQPYMLSQPDSPITACYHKIARQLMSQLQKPASRRRFPKIIIE